MATRSSDLDCPTSPTCSALMTWRIALRSGMRFRTAPEWKKLSTSPRYAFEEIVSNITNTILTPAPYSQV